MLSGVVGAQSGPRDGSHARSHEPRDLHMGCGLDTDCKVYTMQTAVDAVSYCTVAENVAGNPLQVHAPYDLSLASIESEHHQFDKNTVFGGVNVMGGALVDWKHGDKVSEIGFVHAESLLPLHHKGANQRINIVRDESTFGTRWLAWAVDSNTTDSITSFPTTSDIHIPFTPTATQLLSGHATVSNSTGIDVGSKHWMEFYAIVITPSGAEWYPKIRVMGQNATRLFPPQNEGAHMVPVPYNQRTHALWCAGSRLCPSQNPDIRVGCPGSGTCICARTGTCLQNGECRCHPGYGGFDCASPIPAAFFVHNATACPDFDLCGRRGACYVKSGGFGVACHCRADWFGGDVSTLHRNRVWSREQMIDAYASTFFCEPMADAWADATGWVDLYPELHQCALYDGELRPATSVVDGLTPTNPVSPFNCAGGHGGNGCNRSPNCSKVGTYTASATDFSMVPNDASTVEHISAHTSPEDPTEYPPMKCNCKPSYVGPLCDKQLAPTTTLHNVCGERDGHGAPAFGTGNVEPWNSSYTTRCRCHDGWGGDEGNCAVEVCPHSVTNSACGPRGICLNAECECEAGWALGTTGLCDQRMCAFHSGFECGAVVVREGLPNAGSSVCDRDVTDPHCRCELGPNGTAFSANGPEHACDLDEANACIGGGIYGLCGNVGTCVQSTPSYLAPHCVCPPGFYGSFCERDACGVAGYCKGRTNDPGKAFDTGQCDATSGLCDCWLAESTFYGGTSCDDEQQFSQNFGSYDTGSVCSGHGKTAFGGIDWGTINPAPTSVSCDCDEGYTGTLCQTMTGTLVTSCTESGFTCGGDGACICDEALNPGCSYRLCPGTAADQCSIVGGHYSSEGFCHCYGNYMGKGCFTDGCSATGGTPVGHKVCDCTALGGQQYPQLGIDAKPWSVFRGCRKKCVVNEDMEECGGAQPTRLTRCDGAPVNMSSTGTAVCNCSLPSANRNTHTIGTWIAGGGTCTPTCERCVELPDGTCDSSRASYKNTGVCQHSGDNRDQLICGTNPASTWNGSHCDCHPRTLFTRTDGTQTSWNCSRTICDEQPHSTSPEPPLVACVCDGAFVTDWDALSPTFLHCVPHCGANSEHFNNVTNICDCDAIHTGEHCALSLCVWGHTAVGIGTNASCVSDYPQFGGTFANDSVCVSGDPKNPPGVGCDCPATRTGLYCQHAVCSIHGVAIETAGDHFCACEQGWTGDECQYSSCGYTLPITPELCGSQTNVTCNHADRYFNCNCGQVATYDPGLGCVADRVCANDGAFIADGTNTLTCACADGFHGTFCDHHVCDGRRNIRHTIAKTGSVSMSMQNAAEPFVREFGVFDCVCAFPYSNFADHCADVNCSAIAVEGVSVATTMIQRTPHVCGCIDNDRFRIERYNPFVHTLGVNVTHDTHSLYPRHDDARVMSKFLCVRNCHPVHTRHVVGEADCVCHIDWSGLDCESYVGGVDDGSGIVSGFDQYRHIRPYVIWVPIVSLCFIAVVAEIIMVFHKR